ncbi:putative nuclease HARBI1 [Notothenia coriiceps]|uniref:Nuclease HARBI1 n=1 Tax=Notothenia coriiceps TaxID=8208 RepID=A0A6I9NMH0_9TELE|nr:PREDICTED: putative nuclease HARBI1 [Notothenia coriiceps]
MSHADDQRGILQHGSLLFHRVSHCPRVLGCIDCTHIPISACLGDNEGDYVHRKSFHSLNIQATCDHRCIITSLEAKWPGSVHDSRCLHCVTNSSRGSSVECCSGTGVMPASLS